MSKLALCIVWEHWSISLPTPKSNVALSLCVYRCGMRTIFFHMFIKISQIIIDSLSWTSTTAWNRHECVIDATQLFQF